MEELAFELGPKGWVPFCVVNESVERLCSGQEALLQPSRRVEQSLQEMLLHVAWVL